MSDNHDRSAELPTWLRERMEAGVSRIAEHVSSLCTEEAAHWFRSGAEACYRALLEAGPEFDETAAFQAFPDDGFSRPDFVDGARWQHEQDRAALAAMKAECKKLDEEVREWMDKSNANWRRAESADANAALKGLDKFESLEAEVVKLKAEIRTLRAGTGYGIAHPFDGPREDQQNLLESEQFKAKGGK